LNYLIDCFRHKDRSAGSKDSQSNNLYFCLAIFGRIASLQIACLAELNGALCASHCIPNPAVKMHNLLLYEPLVNHL
jgi:hypothetical protein